MRLVGSTSAACPVLAFGAYPEPIPAPRGDAQPVRSGAGACAAVPGTAVCRRHRASIAARAAAMQRVLLCAITTRSEEHTSELQSLMRISYAVFCLTKKNKNDSNEHSTYT